MEECESKITLDQVWTAIEIAGDAGMTKEDFKTKLTEVWAVSDSNPEFGRQAMARLQGIRKWLLDQSS